MMIGDAPLPTTNGVVLTMDIQPLLDPPGMARLRRTLRDANYTSAGIAERIGPQATAALRRNDFRAAIRATEDRDPLATLIRLFVCGQTEPAAAVAEALPAVARLALTRPAEDGTAAAVAPEPAGDDRG